MPYNHVTIDERDFLQSAIVMQLDTAIIARIIGKYSATIYRESKRNSTKGYYVASGAQVKAVTRRYETKPLPKQGNKVLMQDIKRRFLQDHSPEQIAGRLKLEYPGQKERHASTELIYQHLYGCVFKEPDKEENQPAMSSLCHSDDKKRSTDTAKPPPDICPPGPVQNSVLNIPRVTTGKPAERSIGINSCHSPVLSG